MLILSMLCTRNLGYKILPFMDRICLPTIGPHVSLFTLQRFNNNLAKNKLTYVACIDEYILNAEAYIYMYIFYIHACMHSYVKVHYHTIHIYMDSYTNETGFV